MQNYLCDWCRIVVVGMFDPLSLGRSPFYSLLGCARKMTALQVARDRGKADVVAYLESGAAVESSARTAPNGAKLIDEVEVEEYFKIRMRLGRCVPPPNIRHAWSFGETVVGGGGGGGGGGVD